MALLSLGASPFIEAITPAVIIDAIPASIIETFAINKSIQPKIKHIKIATVGAKISLIIIEIIMVLSRLLLF